MLTTRPILTTWKIVLSPAIVRSYRRLCHRCHQEIFVKRLFEAKEGHHQRNIKYTLWVKKQDTLVMSITSRKIDRFSRFFHWQTPKKLSTKQVLYSPPYLTDVAALPCVTAMFQKSYKFKNTSSTDVVLKYFCGCSCLISFFRQIRVSIKNYEISVRVKNSVRDLIYDIHICAWATMTQ